MPAVMGPAAEAPSHSRVGPCSGAASTAAAAVGRVPDVSGSGGPDQAPKGTGVFMPMVARSYSNGRSKPQRRRNASTSCLIDANRNRQPRRNCSNANLHMLVEQPHTERSCAGSGGSSSGELRFGAGLPTDMLDSPGSTRSTNTVLLPAGTGHLSSSPIMLPCSGGPIGPSGMAQRQAILPAQQQQQQQQVVRQQQVVQQLVSPFAVTSASFSSASTSLGVTSFDSEMCPMSGCLSLSTDLRMLAANTHSQQLPQQGSIGVTGMPYSNGMLQPRLAGTTPGLTSPEAQVASFQGLPLLAMQPSVGLQEHILGSSPGQGMRRSFSYSNTGDTLGTTNSAGLSGTQGANTDPVMAQWAALGLSEQDLLAALAHVQPSSDTNLEQQQDQIQQYINRLSVMKELLRMKQQHKAQQQLLQLQQQQQEQLLQQQLLQIETSSTSRGGFNTDIQGIPQELLQLLHRHAGDELPVGINMPAAVSTLTPAASLQLPACSLLDGTHKPTTPDDALVSLLQQQQLDNTQVLQTADAATLSGLLQDRLSFRPTTHLSAPSNTMAARQPVGTNNPSSLTAVTCLPLQGWGPL